MSFLGSFAVCPASSLVVILSAIIRQICIRTPNDMGTYTAQDGNTKRYAKPMLMGQVPSVICCLLRVSKNTQGMEWEKIIQTHGHARTRTYTATHFLPAGLQLGSILDPSNAQLKASSKWYFKSNCNANPNFKVFNKTLLR